MLRVRNFNVFGRQRNGVLKAGSLKKTYINNEVILFVICISKCHHLIRFLVEIK